MPRMQNYLMHIRMPKCKILRNVFFFKQQMYYPKVKNFAQTKRTKHQRKRILKQRKFQLQSMIHTLVGKQKTKTKKRNTKTNIFFFFLLKFFWIENPIRKMTNDFKIKIKWKGHQSSLATKNHWNDNTKKKGQNTWKFW